MESGSLAGKVGRGLGWSTGGNVVLRMGSLLISVAMARLIAPEQFGVFAVAMTLWSILSSLAEFGLTAELVRTDDFPGRAPTVATLGVLVGGGLAIIMFATAPLLADAFDSPESTGVVRLMSVSLLLVGLSVVPAAKLYREIRQAAVFAIGGLSLIVSAAVMISLAAAGFGAPSLAWGQIIGQTVTLIAQCVVTRTVLTFGLNRDIAAEAARFCLPLAAANLLSWFLLGIDNIIVARITDPVQLGLYVMAFNVSSWPMTAIGQAVRVVALPAFAQLRTPERRNSVLLRVSGPLWSASVLMGVGLATLAGPLVALLYGRPWEGSVPPLIGLAAFGALRVVFDLLATFLTAAGASRSVLAVQIWWLVALVPAMTYGVREFGLAGAGWAHVVVGFVAVLPAYLFVLKRLGVDTWGFIRRWAVPSACAVPAAAASWWIGREVESPALSLFLGTAAAVILFLATAGPWLRRQLRELRAMTTEGSPEMEARSTEKGTTL